MSKEDLIYAVRKEQAEKKELKKQELIITDKEFHAYRIEHEAVTYRRRHRSGKKFRK